MTRPANIANRICVITGAAGSLCGALAEALGCLGVKVMLLDIDAEKAGERARKINAGGGKAIAMKCDVLNPEDLVKSCRRLSDAYGRADFLINGAGGNRPEGSTDEEFYSGTPGVKAFPDLSCEGMMRTFNLNYFGTVLPTQVFSKGMLEKKKGSIINISSISAINPLTKVVAYSSAKAAVSNFTKWLAVHYSKYNVRVNAIAPGFMMTEQLRFLHLDKQGNYTDRALKVLKHTPAARYGEGRELVGAVVWLLSDEASFVTGSIIPIDGGFTSYSI